LALLVSSNPGMAVKQNQKKNKKEKWRGNKKIKGVTGENMSQMACAFRANRSHMRMNI